VRRAVALATATDEEFRRWVTALDALYLLQDEAESGEARRRIMATLEDTPADEHATVALCCHVLAEIASARETRADLVLGERLFDMALRSWRLCGDQWHERRTRSTLATDVLVPLGRFDDAVARYDELIAEAAGNDNEVCWFTLLRGFAFAQSSRVGAAEADFVTAERLSRQPLNPTRLAYVAWGRAIAACRAGDAAAAALHAQRAENVAVLAAGSMTVPFWCDMSMEFGALGDIDTAADYLARARAESTSYEALVDFTAFLLDARRGVLPSDVAGAFERAQPGLWPRGLIVTAVAAANAGDVGLAAEYLASAESQLAELGLTHFGSVGEQGAHDELLRLLGRLDQATHTVGRSAPVASTLRLIGPLALIDASGRSVPVPGRNQRALLALIAANGGSISADAAAEALWPDQPTGVGRTRLHNIHTRLRAATGTTFRFGETFCLPASMSCDLIEFERLAERACRMLRADPDGASELAFDAAALVGPNQILPEFDGDWAEFARHRASARLSTLVDLLAVQAHDAGDRQLAELWTQRAYAVAS
jgi:hypothetical protein